MANPADSARVRVAHILEATAGTTPATPTFLVLPVTSAGIRTVKKTTPVRQLRTDGNIEAEIQTSQHAQAAYQAVLKYGDFDNIIALALRQATWTANVVKNGTTRKTMSVEETLDLNGSSSYSRLTFGYVDSLSFDVNADSPIQFGFSILGNKETLATSAIASSTYTAASTKQPMSSGISVAALSVASLSSPKVKRVQFEIRNGLQPQFSIDSVYPFDFMYDLIDVTGTIELFLDGNTGYQKVLDHGGGSLSITLGQDTNEHYTVAMSSIQFLDGVRQIGGAGNSVMVSIPFRATGTDNTSNPSIQFTRAVA